MSMTNPPNRIEVVTSVQRRRRWTASEKVRMVEETFAPGMTVSLVARQRGVAKPAVHVAPIGGAREPDRSRQRRGGGAGVGLSGVAEPGARASSAARQEDPGGRDSQGGSGTRHGLKITYGAPRSQVVSTHDSLTQSASTYPVSETLPRPRWRSARLGPNNSFGRSQLRSGFRRGSV